MNDSRISSPWHPGIRESPRWLSKITRVLAAAALSLVVACAGKTPPPDLGNLYNRAARHHDGQRNPVIVIPGVLGSRLVDPTSGRIVWGAFGGGAAHPKRPEDARLIALPMKILAEEAEKAL